MDKLDNYITKLKTMVSIDTVSVFEDLQIEKYHTFQDILRKLFPQVFKTFKFEEFNGSILLSHVVDSINEPILFMAHQDVVEKNGEWKHDPFNAVLEDGRLYGRGTLDIKGFLFTILQSFEELLEEGYSFNRSIYIESSCNEETTQDGAKEIASILKQRGLHFAFVLDEGGFVINNPFGESKNKLAMIALGEKACLEVKFMIKTLGGHASTPENNEPLVLLSKFILEAKRKNRFVSYLPQAEVEMLERVAPTLKGAKRFLFKNAKLLKGLIVKLFRTLSPTTRAMVQSTICFTRIQGSEGNNVIPQCPYVVANIRVSHKETVENCLKKLNKIAKKYKVESEILDPGVESKVCSPQSKEFKFLCKCISDSFEGVVPVPYIGNSASDSKFMGEVSDNVFRFAPFYVDDEQLESVHGLDENIYVDNLIKGVEFIKKVVKEF